jgi:hypothetical protein
VVPRWLCIPRIHIQGFNQPHIKNIPAKPGPTPSYSGGRDQEDCSSKPTRANSSRDLISGEKKKPFTKKKLVEWLKVWALSSNPSTKKKTKTRKNASVHVQIFFCHYSLNNKIEQLFT